MNKEVRWQSVLLQCKILNNKYFVVGGEAMKVVNPIGRSTQGVITPRGCTCSVKKNNYTAMRKYAGSCTYCAASCNDNHGKNYNANMKNAMLKSKY